MEKLKKIVAFASFILIVAFFTGCDKNQQVVSQVDERDANIIIVFLSSKGIPATKQMVASGGMAGENTAPKFNISVTDSQAIDAMALLNQNGLPRKQGTNLLDLFAKQGLMSSDKEETIRYQAGLEQQITNTILLIDGVIDAKVQLSFPPEATGLVATAPTRTTAAVYVKHQGIIDDPNIHLENKIKRLVSGSVNGLDINDVTVVSDRSRFTDITVSDDGEITGPGKEYISIWSIVMSKQSALRFRFIFFIISLFTIFFAISFGWLIWKFYPLLKRKGLKELLSPMPIVDEKKPGQKNEENTPPGR
ncbi:MAG: type III secretion inner membrane ring lipoprotein SctJ [Chlamydiales bacterium]|nr:type III secretion inner membrane ring lipoprotein SctJ [Chlamydiales bacterium]